MLAAHVWLSAIFITLVPVTRYTNLMRLAKERHHRLGETLKLHEVKREVDELHSWISDKVGTSRDATQSIAVLQDSMLCCRIL